VLICDLDGTLLSINSFPAWVRFLIFGHFGDIDIRERLKISFATIGVMLERKLFNKDHAVTKARLQQLWVRADAQDSEKIGLEWLLSDLSATIRPNLSKFLQLILLNRVPSILATAASADYAVPLGQKMGFKNIVATPTMDATNAKTLHNVGTVKRDNVLAFLRANGWENQPRIFFTDHVEDMPLIEVSDKIIWFGNANGMNAVKAAHPNKPIVDGLQLQPKEVLEELTAERTPDAPVVSAQAEPETPATV
jgi:phosphoserine phosphatase